MRAKLCVALIAMLFSGCVVFAQSTNLSAQTNAPTKTSDNAAIYGTVYDVQGNPFANVAVELTNQNTGLKRAALTDDAGNFSFTEVPPNSGYQLTAIYTGLAIARLSGLDLHPRESKIVIPPLQAMRAFPQEPTSLLKADRDFQKATAAQRLEGWMSFMADDAVLVTGAKPVVGKDAIREFHKALDNPDFHLTWEPTRGEMFPAGDMGYTTGRYELRAKNAKGETVVRHGTYLTVWKKQADGSWKVVADGGAPDKQAASSK